VRKRYVVCPVADLPPGERRIVDLGGRSVGVFNIGGRYSALHNRCPHQGAPLCRGRLQGLALGPRPYQIEVTRDGEILRCPWHGWEFDVTNGRSVFNPHRVRTRAFELAIEPDEPDPSIETFRVDVERQMVVVYI
jgi:3-phenylpropionate/trans-cinnamate dioxygenase ferredoxin subunit